MNSGDSVPRGHSSIEQPDSWWWWSSRLGQIDLVGPVVALHVVGLAVLGAVERPVPVLVVAGGLLVWRGVLGVLVARLAPQERGGAIVVRGIVSLILVGALLGLDGGTESPLFFSMLIVITWDTVVNPLRRVVPLGVGAVAVYAGVIVLARDVTAKSLLRLMMLVAFIGLLTWARSLAEHWQRSSVHMWNLVTGVVQTLPLGLAVYEANTLRCILANETATRFGLDTPEETVLTPFGSDTGITVVDALKQVMTSQESYVPGLYAVSRESKVETILRVGVWLGPPSGVNDRLVAYVEDVTDQVSAGEQHRRFLQSADHQFRTPLSPILGYSEMIASGELDGDDLVEAGIVIRDAAYRIEHLLNRISTLVRLQGSRYQPPVTVSVDELIGTYLADVRPDLVAMLTIEGCTDLTIRCAPRTLAMALGELVDNGHRHGIPPVTITVQSEAGRANLRLSDRGPGPTIDPGASLDDTWGLFGRSDVIPFEMGNRLGITYAHTLARTAGATLRFERKSNDWAFVLDLPVGSVG